MAVRRLQPDHRSRRPAARARDDRRTRAGRARHAARAGHARGAPRDRWCRPGRSIRRCRPTWRPIIARARAWPSVPTTPVSPSRRALVAHLRRRAVAVDRRRRAVDRGRRTIRTWPARSAARSSRGEADAGIADRRIRAWDRPWPPTRFAASVRPCARRPRSPATRASTSARTCSPWARRSLTPAGGDRDRAAPGWRRAMTEARYLRRLLKVRRLEEGADGHRARSRWISRGSSPCWPRRSSRRRAAGPAASPLRCHAVAEDCCPTRMQPIVDAGAARTGRPRAGRRAHGVSPA